MAANGQVRYEFGELAMGQATMANCAEQFNTIQTTWRNDVNALGMEGWFDRANTAFQGISAVWDTGASRCTQFQNDISMAIARCQANGEDALAQCVAIVNR